MQFELVIVGLGYALYDDKGQVRNDRVSINLCRLFAIIISKFFSYDLKDFTENKNHFVRQLRLLQEDFEHPYRLVWFDIRQQIAAEDFIKLHVVVLKQVK